MYNENNMKNCDELNFVMDRKKKEKEIHIGTLETVDLIVEECIKFYPELCPQDLADSLYEVTSSYYQDTKLKTRKAIINQYYRKNKITEQNDCIIFKPKVIPKQPDVFSKLGNQRIMAQKHSLSRYQNTSQTNNASSHNYKNSFQNSNAKSNLENVINYNAFQQNISYNHNFQNELNCNTFQNNLNYNTLQNNFNYNTIQKNFNYSKIQSNSNHSKLQNNLNCNNFQNYPTTSLDSNEFFQTKNYFSSNQNIPDNNNNFNSNWHPSEVKFKKFSESFNFTPPFNFDSQSQCMSNNTFWGDYGQTCIENTQNTTTYAPMLTLSQNNPVDITYKNFLNNTAVSNHNANFSVNTNQHIN